MNQLETKLNAWEPRRPSGKLRLSLFPETPTATVEESRAEQRFGWMGWLTPVTAAATVLAVALSSTGLPLPPAMAAETNLALVAAQADRYQQSTWNHVGGETFKWTNSLHPPSTNASLNSAN